MRQNDEAFIETPNGKQNMHFFIKAFMGRGTMWVFVDEATKRNPNEQQ